MTLPIIVSKLGLPLLVSLLGSALLKVGHPVAQSAGRALQNFEGAIAGGMISPEQMAEANRHAEAMAAAKAQEYSSALSEINQSLRTEVSSEDVYVRRMRPTFGYLMAFTWAIQMLGLAYVVTFETHRAAAVLGSMESLSTMWMVGLSVLGIYVYKRSEEKKTVVSIPPVQTPAQPKEEHTVEKTTNIKPAAKPPTYND